MLAQALLTLIGKIYHVFKIKVHFRWEYLSLRLSGYYKHYLIVRMTGLTVKDITAALNACVSVRDWETLTRASFLKA